MDFSLPVIGAFAQGAGSLLSGVSSFFDNSPDMSSYNQSQDQLAWSSYGQQLNQYEEQALAQAYQYNTSLAFAQAQEAFRQEAWQYETELARNAYFNGISDRVADAEAAGIHPLYALGASTGYSGGGQMGSVSGPQGMAAPSGISPSGGNLIQSGARDAVGMGLAGLGQGLTGVGSAMDAYSRLVRQETSSTLEDLLTAAQIEEMSSRTSSNLAQAQLYTSEAKRAESEVMVKRAVPSGFGGNENPAKDRTVHMLGGDVRVPGRYSSAQDAQNEFGELGEWYQGAALLVRGVWENAMDAINGFGKRLIGEQNKRAPGGAGMGWGSYK